MKRVVYFTAFLSIIILALIIAVIIDFSITRNPTRINDLRILIVVLSVSLFSFFDCSVKCKECL